MLERLLKINENQKELIKILNIEKYDDIYSILRNKNHIDKYIELEIQKNLLIELLYTQKFSSKTIY